MSLQYVLTPISNNMIVERQDLHSSCDTPYKKWREQVTTVAVEKALQYQLESQRSPHEKKTESWRDSGVGCSKPFSPLSFFHTMKNSTSSQHSRSWSLEKDSEDRRHVAAKIYALLVEWKSDFSFEWRAQVAAAVHTFEEAMYQQAKSKEEYTDPLSLDLQLRQVLCWFESGNGPRLLQGPMHIDPLQSCNSPLPAFCSAASSTNITNTPESQIVVSQELSIPERSQDTTLDNETLIIPKVNTALTGTLGSISASGFRLARKEAANGALWQAFLIGQTRTLEEGLHKFASKKLVKKVISMIPKKKREEQRRLKLELQKAMMEHSAENLATLLARAKLRYSSELKDLCNAAEIVLGKLLEEATGEQRKRNGKTLREMLTLGNPETSLSIIDVAMGMQPAESASCPAPVSQRSEETPSSDAGIHCESGFTSNSEVVVLEFISCMPELPVMGSTRIVPTDAVGPDIEIGSEGSSFSRCEQQSLASAVQGNSAVESPQSNAEFQEQQSSIEAVQTPQTENVDLSSESSTETLYSGMENVQSDDHDQEEASDPLGLVEYGEEQQHNIISETHENRAEHAHYPGTEATETEGPAAQESTSRVSLMRLLQEGDGGISLLNQHKISSPFPYDSAPWDTWEEPTEELDPLCCVCMVGLKGAAFIPCGHTFCRKCSRELWRGRGTCPLCNRYIGDILDIY